MQLVEEEDGPAYSYYYSEESCAPSPDVVGPLPEFPVAEPHVRKRRRSSLANVLKPAGSEKDGPDDHAGGRKLEGSPSQPRETLVEIKPLGAGVGSKGGAELPKVQMRVQDAILLHPRTRITTHSMRERAVAMYALLRASGSRTRKLWDVWILALVVAQAITVPIRLGFRSLWGSHSTYIGLIVVDYLSDAFFWADIALLFVTPYSDRGVFITSKKRIRNHYLHGAFALDFVATLPIDLIHWGFWQHAALRLPRLLRLFRYKHYTRVWEQRTNHQSFFRMAKLFAAFLLLIHFLACSYMAISYDRGFGSSQWVAKEPVESMSTANQYLYAYFWATNQLTNKGGGIIRPQTLFEMGIELVIALMALFGIATIIGAISRIIAQLDISGEKFRQKMLEVNLFMRNRKIPPELADRIRDHYVALWSRHGGIDTSHILMELPITLRTSVALYMNRELFSKVPLFQSASPGFVESLAPHLVPHIFSPGDVVIKEGSTGSEMFFISRGTVKVIQHGEVINTLHQGAFFGELSLLVPETARTATVQTVSYCDLFVLSKKDLATVLKTFPKEEAVMMAKAKRLKWLTVLRTRLGECPALEGATEKLLVRLRDAFVTADYRSTDTVFEKGTPVQSIYFVAEGWIQVLEEDGRLGVQIPSGSFVGGIPSHNIGDGGEDDEVQWVATGVAGTSTTLLELTHEAYDSFCNAQLSNSDALVSFAVAYLLADATTLPGDISGGGSGGGGGDGGEDEAERVEGGGGVTRTSPQDDQAQLERIVPILGDIAGLMEGHNGRYIRSLKHASLDLNRLSSQQLLNASDTLSRLSFIVSKELFVRRSDRRK